MFETFFVLFSQTYIYCGLTLSERQIAFCMWLHLNAIDASSMGVRIAVEGVMCAKILGLLGANLVFSRMKPYHVRQSIRYICYAQIK